MIKMNSRNSVGINGFGRIGKLTLWNLILSDEFDEIVINVGREVGRSLEDLVDYAVNDSTYGSLAFFLFGHKGEDNDFVIVDKDKGEVDLFGKKVVFLRKSRNPENIGWGEYSAKIVVDTTGRFNDPADDSALGKRRGHRIRQTRQPKRRIAV